MEATGTATNNASTNKTNNFIDRPIRDSQGSCVSIFKKILYFSHFILIAVYTTQILIRNEHARDPSFTLFALLIYGYMIFWTVLANFVLISCGKQNYAVMFDRLFIKFFIMIWPIFGSISYIEDTFLNITQVAIFALYMTAASFLLILYELYNCIFAEHENPKYIFEHNDLKQSQDVVWGYRRTYNQNIIDRKHQNQQIDT